MTEPLGPVDAARSLLQSFSTTDAFYTAISVAGVFLFYAIAARRPSTERPTWLRVMFWLIALVGWGFEMYMVTGAKIAEGGPGAWLFMVGAAVILMLAIPVLIRRSKFYERIISGTAIALIGFGILASFGRGYRPYGWALVMGLVLGLIIGLFLSIRDRIDTKLDALYVDAGGKKQNERKVTEI